MCTSPWLLARDDRNHTHSSLRALYIVARSPACSSFFLISLIALDSASFGLYAFASRLLRLCVSSAAPLRLCSSLVYLCSAASLLCSSRLCTAALLSALLCFCFLLVSLHCTSGLLLCSVSASRSDLKTSTIAFNFK